MIHNDRASWQAPEDAGTTTVTSTHDSTDGVPLQDVPFEDVTVMLLVKNRQRRSLAKWARKVSLDPHLSRCRLMVVNRSHGAANFARDSLDDYLEAETTEETDALEPEDEIDYDIEPLLREMTQLTESGDPDESETLSGYHRVFDAIPTTYFSVHTLPRRSPRIESLKQHIARETARVAEIGLTSARPTMLYSHDRSLIAPRAYVHRELELLGPDPDPLHRDYLAFLALATSTPKLEGVDLRADDRVLDLFGRVSLGRFNSHEPPPWTYRVVVTGPHKEVLTEAGAEFQQRVDNKGDRRWENLVARLPVDEIPEGNHRLMIGVETQYAPLRSLQSLQPRPGVLAPARTVLLRSEKQEPSAPETRYLMHTVRGSDTWITLQRGSGKGALKRWNRSMVRKDARAVLKGAGGRRMGLARLVRLATLPYFRAKDIWLVGERADTAQDNGFHFFRHMRETSPDRRVYYVIDADSPQFSRVKHLGNVVRHSSVRHRLLMMHATVLANAYSIKHMIPRQWSAGSYTRGLAWRVGAHRVYLKHGVHVSPTAVKRGTGGYDLYLAVNPQEKAALQESSGYGDHVVETGMPRYDTLVPTPRSRTILFMPTWRRYLVPKLFGPTDEASVPFEGSTYERFVTGLMNSPVLHDILTRHDYRLQLLPHYNLRQEMEGFQLTSDRTELADTTKNSFQDLIRGCDAFITDYSSVHFDVAYLGTPIIYTHFDKEEYEAGHAVPSWFDHETDAFGPVVHTLADTLSELDVLLERGCTRDPAFQPQVDAAFTFHDHNNAARAVEQTELMLERARRGR